MTAVKMTLLEMTQNVMSEMNLDMVNSIQDSSEAMQVANLIQDAFYDAVSTRHWKHLYQLLRMDKTDDIGDRPNYLKIPESTQEIGEIRYNDNPQYQDVDSWRRIEYLTPERFMDKINSFKSTHEDAYIIQDHSSLYFSINSNKKPEYWTSFDDQWILFDSWQKDKQATVAAAQTWVHGVIMPSFFLDDAYVMDMPLDAQRQIIADAKGRASILFMGKVNPKAEQAFNKTERWLSRKQWVAAGGIQYGNYGRKPRRGSSSKSPYIDKSPWKPN